MAEEVKMTPVEMTPVSPEPPKVNPLAKPDISEAKTLKLAPAVRRPTVAGASAGGLKPGLKLPPKPGATVSALKPGLKLPPKPGATVSALKPGLKLPPKPGATVSALKPGLKLPPKPGATIAAKPIIRKPGEGAAASPVLPKPVLPKPVKPVTETPAETSAAATSVAPKPTVMPVDAQGVGKLPTVEAKAVPREEVATAPAPEAIKPLAALKSVTQKLKGVTQPIPQQAILHKTGIIAEAATSEAQKEAAKHKTARISLSDAMGVAPVKNEPAPMKTIRIKRPINLQTPPAAPTASAPAAAPEAVPTATAAKPAAPAPSVTQRKTLKISRPGTAVRPAGKFGVKKPMTQATTVAKNPAAPAAAAEAGEVADIADIPDMPAAPVPPMPASVAEPAPGWPTTLATIIELAACVVVGTLAWYLYENAQLATFCGGLGWGA